MNLAETTAGDLVASADGFRPWLLDEQAATEERSYYSEELHQAFARAGFYRMRSILLRCGELFHEYAREAMQGGRTFDGERTFRIYGQLMTAHKLCSEAGDMVFRAGSTHGARDGARLQRYFRDLCAFRTNGVHQLDFQATSIAEAHLGLPIGVFDRG